MSSRWLRLRLTTLLAVAALSLMVPPTAIAHAELVDSTPANGETVVATPDELMAIFNEPVLEESSLSIRDAQGQRLAVGHVDPEEPTRLVISDLPELGRGTYEMRWTAATADGQVERGTWSFSIAPAPPTKVLPTPPDSASSSASPSAAASPSASEPLPSVTATPSGPIVPPDDPAASTAEVFLPILAGLAIVLVAAGFLLSRRGRPPDRP